MVDIGRIIEFEEGQLDNEQVVDLFCDLLNTGTIHGLQGSYQRTAQNLIDNRLIKQNENNEWEAA